MTISYWRCEPLHFHLHFFFLVFQELNRSVHSMQSRVADLIERCQDEIVLESTLQINDELNSVFVRYERCVIDLTDCLILLCL